MSKELKPTHQLKKDKYNKNISNMPSSTSDNGYSKKVKQKIEVDSILSELINNNQVYEITDEKPQNSYNNDNSSSKIHLFNFSQTQ